MLSKIQEQTLKQIREAGGVAAVVRFQEEVRQIIESERRRNEPSVKT